ncbi:hypothetical protein B0H14DRAFT_1181487 [Mycena olivaceomarginata]|nr:hypothetical protein B0H14DRAFT_1181487 [Mycena olivaceomarginata]
MLLKPTRPPVELGDSSESSLADLQELRLEFVHSTLRTRNSSSSSLNIPETLRFPQLVTLALALYQYLSGLYYRSPSLDLSRCLMFNLKFMHYTSVFSTPSAIYISSLSNLRDNDLSSLLGYRFPFVLRYSSFFRSPPYNILLLEFPRTFPGAFFHPPAMRGPGAKHWRPFARTMTVDAFCSECGT